jgi:PAS domain S-box-containing protein
MTWPGEIARTPGIGGSCGKKRAGLGCADRPTLACHYAPNRSLIAFHQHPPKAQGRNQVTEARIAPCPGRAESFRRFVLEAPLNAVLMDLRGHIVAHSPAFKSWLGYSRSIVDKHVSETVEDPEVARTLVALRAAFAAGETCFTTVRNVHVGDQSIWIRTQVTHWHDDDGVVCGYLCLNQDVTAEHEAELRRREMEVLLKAVVENIPATVSVQDYDTDEYLLVNRRIAELLSKKPEEMIGQTAAGLVPDRSASIAAIRERIASQAEGGSAEIELDETWGKKPSQVLRFKRAVFEDMHGRKRVLTVGEDVTDIRRTAQALEAAVAEAKSANAAKSNFLTNISHEIRTPLNGVLGMVQVMAQDPLPAKQQERLQLIRQCGETLLGLLNDLLDMSKIEAGRLELESLEFDLEELVESVCAASKLAAEQKGLKFDIQFTDTVGNCRGDPTRLRQVITNLISNAVKFTEGGGITVSCRREGDHVRFSVADSGIGMAREVLDRLFGKFVQADASTTRRFGGSGLGLAISRDLVHLMGGQMSVESAPGQGSQFFFDVPLPRVDGHRHRAADSRSDLQGSNSLRILAAEDNRINQKVLEAFLATAGHAAVFVGNGADAVKAWEEAFWDVILMDVQMPVMDGTEAAKIIRCKEAELGRAPTPIIALTANAMSHQTESYLALGMDAVVSKPFEVKHLLETIDRLTAGNRNAVSVPLARSA